MQISNLVYYIDELIKSDEALVIEAFKYQFYKNIGKMKRRTTLDILFCKYCFLKKNLLRSSENIEELNLVYKALERCLNVLKFCEDNFYAHDYSLEEDKNLLEIVKSYYKIHDLIDKSINIPLDELTTSFNNEWLILSAYERKLVN